MNNYVFATPENIPEEVEESCINAFQNGNLTVVYLAM